MEFEEEKKKVLGRKDKSKIGKIDDNIKSFVGLINSHPDYYTTSSCSGRIMLISRKSEKKIDSSWLFVSHDAVDFMEIWKVVGKLPKEDTWFRAEPLILHVSCRDINCGEALVKAAREIGFKRAGIQSATKRINVEICGSDYLDTIVGKNKQLLVDGDYLKVLVTEANKKLSRNLKRIYLFEDRFKEMLKKKKEDDEKNAKQQPQQQQVQQPEKK